MHVGTRLIMDGPPADINLARFNCNGIINGTERRNRVVSESVFFISLMTSLHIVLYIELNRWWAGSREWVNERRRKNRKKRRKEKIEDIRYSPCPIVCPCPEEWWRAWGTSGDPLHWMTGFGLQMSHSWGTWGWQLKSESETWIPVYQSETTTWHEDFQLYFLPTAWQTHNGYT